MDRKIHRENDRTSEDPSLSGNGALVCIVYVCIIYVCIVFVCIVYVFMRALCVLCMRVLYMCVCVHVCIV